MVSIEAIATFLVIFGACMNISFIIELEILMLIKWVYKFPQLCSLYWDLINMFQACSPLSFAERHVLLVSVLEFTLNHTPLKYTCMIKTTYWFRHVIQLLLLHLLLTMIMSWNLCCISKFTMKHQQNTI